LKSIGKGDDRTLGERCTQGIDGRSRFRGDGGLSCWEKVVAEFEDNVLLGVAAVESSGEVVPINGVDSCFGPLFELNAVFEESVIAKGPADGARKVSGHGLACHEELYFGVWKKGNAVDEVWKGTQLGGCKFVSVAVELGRKR
jgi:hypothetical protein